jgi:hypothetical protein
MAAPFLVQGLRFVKICPYLHPSFDRQNAERARDEARANDEGDDSGEDELRAT